MSEHGSQSPTDLSALRLFVRYDEGRGPVIVFLHGLNSDATDWRKVIDRIGPGYRCIAVDLLGFGESPKPLDIDYSADEHSLVLDATLNDLRIAEKFVLVGYSLGGDIAIRYAAQHPNRLRRLFMLSAPFYLPPSAFARASFGTRFFSEIAFKRLWKFIARSKKNENPLYELASGRLEAAASSFLRTGDVPTHWDIMSKNLTNCIGRATFVDDLPKLRMPTVFALGVRDPIVHPDQTPRLKQLKPDMEIRRIIGLTADHFMLLNLPEKVADEVLRDEVKSLHVVHRAGKGEPLVLLHGIDSSSEQWRPSAYALARGNTVAVIDLLGFGASPAPLSSHFTLEDQSAAVWATVRKLFGDRRVRFVGQGYGALVALACATERPDAVAEVVAFSPTLVPPGFDATRTNDPELAELLAQRDTLRSVAGDERAQALSSERLERHAVPVLRSLDAILGTDADRLLGSIKASVRFVVPQWDRNTPRAYVEQHVASRDDFELWQPNGDRFLPFSDPPAAVALIDPGREDLIKAARAEEPLPSPKHSRLAEYLNTVNSMLVRRGLLMLLGGLPLLLLPSIPPRVVAVGLATWLLVEALQTIAGAFGLRRQGKMWLPWFLVGLVSGGFALFLTAGEAFAVQLTALYFAGWALVRGSADLYVAWRVGEIPGRRWLLVAEGLLGVAIGALILLAPQAGAALLRYTLGAYLTASGIVTLAYAWATNRDTRRRIRAYLGTGETASAKR